MGHLTKQFNRPNIKDIGPSIRRVEDDIATSEAIARFKKLPGHAQVVRELDKLVARLRGRKRKGTGRPRTARARKQGAQT